MISEKMSEELNEHLNAELYSSYLYLSMSAYASHKGLSGAAHWLYMQAQEEMIHVQKFYEYLNDQDARIILETIEKPPTEFGAILELFNAVLGHEKEVTARVNKLMTLAVKESDHATQTFLQWFVTEQTEEEKTVRDIIDKLKLAGDSTTAVFMIEGELSSRVAPQANPGA
ncbi:MAG: ferritin [Deltaproteobacteria bacterium]|nr:ferritin [Deltaproteobacteria bacterium]